jgi:hypothetical protein
MVKYIVWSAGMITFDLENTSDNYGFYDSLTDNITIYLKEIYSDFLGHSGIHEDRLFHTIVDVIIHEELHKAIDPCLLEPEIIDDHKIYKYLGQI